ncbi:helix-turn-helix domain-containing protein [uncultured Oscillibacter sp.]|uniref:helix-turn-helix domain-containing protein n=1 Tax=uncultured Oscillibacter sp. TaxID=876091 RepID=UPI00261E8DAA|nr:helix-turn-helix domain-containing protein [uncultured Oscillibacter sp.]
MKTYPNQKVIHIQKRTYEDNFLQVGNDEWQRAARELSGSAFKLYLYLAGNKDGFELALSQKAVEDTTGLSKNTYHRAVEELETKGYLSSTKGNVYVFSPSPSGVSPQNGYIPEISNNEVNIEIGPTYIYGTNEDTVEQHREVTRKFTNEILSKINIKR